MALRLSLQNWYDPGMPPDLGQIGPITLRTYTLLLDLAIVIGLAVLTWQGWQIDDEPGRWLDAGLWALAAGVIGGRLVHVVVHWQYFSDHMSSIPALWEGGISWHGAVLVGLAAIMIAANRLGVNFRRASLVLAFLLPVAAVLTEVGCMASGCGHGREVVSLAGYPPYIAAELPDLYGIVAPRFQTQLFEVAFNIILLLLALALVRMPRLAHSTFWVILGLSGLGAFAIDFTRGDAMPMVGSLRLDQIFDLLVMLVGLAGIAGGRRVSHPAPPPRQQRIFQSIGDDDASDPGAGPD